MALTQTDLGGYLKCIASGKVRDLYEIDKSTLLFVATDRISAYDVVMENGIPMKGKLLTMLSAFWFDILSKQIPALRTHLITLELPPTVGDQLPPELQQNLKGRSMQVRKLRVFPIEAIVRGYITGSAWVEYQRTGTVHGLTVPEGLRESEKLPEPMYTPSTKAELGGKDENIHPEKAAEIVGKEYAQKIQDLALELYSKVHFIS